MGKRAQRVLHLVHQYAPEHVGGTEIYTQQLAVQLTDRGFDTAVFYRRDGEGVGLARRLDGAVPVWGAWAGTVSAAARFRAIFGQTALTEAWRQVLSEMTPDLVHVQHLMGLPAALLRELIRRDIPYIITFHDYWWRCANAQLLTNDTQSICAGPRAYVNCGRCALTRAGLESLNAAAPLVAPLLALRQRQLTPLVKRAAAVVAPTQFVLDKYRELELPLPNAHLIRHGIEVPPTLPPRVENNQPHVLRIVYTGSIARQKGVHVLIDAVNQLPEAGITLTLYGGMNTFPAYADALRRQARHPGITFAGQVPRAELWSALANADVAVVPTLWYEVSPLTIDEMFHARIPIVGSRLGALPEKIQEGVDGLLFPPGSAAELRQHLLELWQSPDLRRTLQTGIRPVRTMRDHVDEMVTLYHSIAGKTG